MVHVEILLFGRFRNFDTRVEHYPTVEIEEDFLCVFLRQTTLLPLLLYTIIKIIVFPADRPYFKVCQKILNKNIPKCYRKHFSTYFNAAVSRNRFEKYLINYFFRPKSTCKVRRWRFYCHLAVFPWHVTEKRPTKQWRLVHNPGELSLRRLCPIEAFILPFLPFPFSFGYLYSLFRSGQWGRLLSTLRTNDYIEE